MNVWLVLSKRAVCVTLVVAVCFLLPAASLADEFTSTDFNVLDPVMAPSGYATSSSFQFWGTIEQIAVGTSTGTSFSLNSGFLAFPYVSTPVVSATAGDAQVALSWSVAHGLLGWTPSAYAVGQSSVSGGPYSFTNVGNVLSATQSGLTNGTPYYFVVRVLDAFGTTIATSSQVTATPTAPAPSTPPASGGSSGSIPSVPPTSGATVSFTGRAYPGSTITLLKDGQFVASTIADANANFQMSLSGISAGHFMFTLYSEDSAGNRSALVTFPLGVTANVTTSIGGIFIAPTIDVDKSQVKLGDNLAIFGQAAPQSAITISVHSAAPIFLRTASDKTGAYLYNLDTSVLELGTHLAQSKAAVAGSISDFSPAVDFVVGTQNVAKVAKPTKLVGDLTGDGRVNLTDFSILLYWYQRPLSGAGLKADLNNDGKVDLVDFSILVTHWTG